MSIRLGNSCFIHVPRTGGLWFGAIIGRLGIKHQKLTGDIDSHLPYSQLPANWQVLPHSFAFVRNPWEWVKSRWSHSLEIKAFEDHRYYGIHREFDEIVAPSFRQTVINLLDHSPQLVSRTYREMTEGVGYLFRTEDLCEVIPSFLHKFEGIERERTQGVIKATTIFNQSSRLPAYRDQYSGMAELVTIFARQEAAAYQLWEKATYSPALIASLDI